jgi:hypothetical protein
MRRLVLLTIAALALVLAGGAQAQSFENKDWQVACDNMRTCRAAGYQRDEETGPGVSVLFTRLAGPRAGVSGEVRVADNGEGHKLPASLKLTIAGKPAGNVALARNGNQGELSGSQVEAMLKALVGTGAIAFSAGKTTWRLSGDGAASVLLKMDDLQGRVGTASAIVRRGTLSDDNVKLPLAPPTVRAVRIGKAQPGDEALAARIIAMIPHNDDCALLDDPDARQDAMNVPRLWHLDANRVLVTVPCWRAAYNEGDGFWIANAKPPFAARTVTLSATDFDEATSTLVAMQKGRGVADCVAEDRWTWNGFAFEPTSSTTSGMCRGIAPGGAWNLPTVVTDVIPAK